MERVWVIASGKGGTGKSAVAVNLGAVLAAEGRRVLLVDLNVGLRCLDLFLGLDDRVLFDVMDVLEGSCRYQDAVLSHPLLPSLFLLPAAQNRPASGFDGNRLRRLCEGLMQDFDLILLDCPPGLDPIPTAAAVAAGRGLVVTTLDPVSIRDADRMAAELSGAGVKEIYLLVNRVRKDWLQNQKLADSQEFAAAIGLPLLGTVPEDDEIGLSILSGLPAVVRRAESPAARSLASIARRLPGKELW